MGLKPQKKLPAKLQGAHLWRILGSNEVNLKVKGAGLKFLGQPADQLCHQIVT
jgi:hypothetical protein